MSILLDALKKSEQERQLGQTPTLRSGADEPAASRPPAAPWIALAMGLLSAVAIAWFGLQQFQVPVAEEIATAVSETREQPIVSEADKRPDNEPEGEVQSSQPRTMTELYGLNRKKRKSGDTEPAAGGDSKRGELSRSVRKYTAEKAKPEPDRLTAGNTRSPEETLAQTRRPRPPVTETEAAATNSKDRRKRIEPHVAEPISYWELPQGIRDDLPEIKISVLVFADEPEDRFLLTNGLRMVEKDELGGGLVLDEIRKDGAVFLYRNYRFLVKG